MLLLQAGEGGAKEMVELSLCVGHLALGLKWAADVVGAWKGNVEELRMMAEKMAVMMVCELELGRETGQQLGSAERDSIALMAYDIFHEGQVDRLLGRDTSIYVRECMDEWVRRGKDLVIGMQGGRGRAGSKSVFSRGRARRGGRR